MGAGNHRKDVRFFWAALSVLLIAGIVVALVLSGAARSREESSATIEAGHAVQAGVVQELTSTDLARPVSPDRYAKLDAQVRVTILTDGPYTSVRVWGLDGTVDYATDRAQLGAHSSERDLLRGVIRDGAQSRVVGGTFQSFVPIRFHIGDAPSGVAELDQPYDPIWTAATRPWRLVAVALGVALLLSIGLFLISYREERSPSTSTPQVGWTGRPRPQAKGVEAGQDPSGDLKREAEARRKAEERARSAEDRATGAEEDFAKALEELRVAQAKVKQLEAGGRGPLEELKKMQGQLQATADRLRQVETERDALRGEIADEQRKAAAVTPAFKGAAEALEKIRRAEEQVAEAEGKARAAEAEAAKADDRVRMAEARAADATSLLEQAETRSDEAAGRAERAEAEATAALARAEAADADVQARVKDELAEAAARVEDAENRAAEAIIRAQGAEGRIAENDSDLRAAETRAEQAASRLLEFEALDAQHEEQLRRITSEHRSAVEQIQQEYEGTITDIKVDQENYLALIRAQHDEQIASLEEQHAQQAAEAGEKLRAADERVADATAELQGRLRQTEEQLAAVAEDHDRQMADLAAGGDAAVAAATADIQERLRQAGAQLAAVAEEHDQQLARVAAEHDERLASATAEHAELALLAEAMASEAEERLTAATQEIDQLRAAVAEAEGNAATAQDELASLRGEDLTEELRVSKVQERQATEQLQSTQEKLAHAQSEIRQLQQRLSDAEADVVADERPDLEAVLRSTQERLAGSAKRLEQMEDRAHQAEHELSVLRAQIEHDKEQRETSFDDIQVVNGQVMNGVAPAESPGNFPAVPLEDRRAAAPFTAALSMDARNSLTRILGLVLTLKHQTSPGEQAPLLKQLASHTRKLDHVVSDLLDSDRLARGAVALNRRRTDIEALARRVIEESGIRGERQIEVRSERVIASVDPVRAEQIVGGLLANSVSRTGPGDTLRVRIEPADGGVVIAVEDDKPASDAAMSPVVARFADMHGGWAKVEGRRGDGSSFKVFLPEAPPRSDDASATGEREDASDLHPEVVETLVEAPGVESVVVEVDEAADSTGATVIMSQDDPRVLLRELGMISPEPLEKS